MRKIVLVACLLIGLSTASYGQFVFGVKAGYSSSLGFDRAWNFDTKNLNFQNDLQQGFHAGLMMRVGRVFIFQPELLYNFQTGGVNVSESTTSSRSIKLSTFDLPLLIGLKAGQGKNFNFRVLVGPKFRFNAGSSNTVVGGADDGLTTTTRNWQLGLDTGIGFDIWRFTLDLRYNLMPNLYKYMYTDENVSVNTNPTNSFTLSLGFKFVDKAR